MTKTLMHRTAGKLSESDVTLQRCVMAAIPWAREQESPISEWDGRLFEEISGLATFIQGNAEFEMDDTLLSSTCEMSAVRIRHSKSLSRRYSDNALESNGNR